MGKNDPVLAGVTLARDAFGDPRHVYLAELCGLANHYEALGRMAMLWSICTALKTNAPPRAKIVVCLGKNGPEALVESDLGELLEDGTIRVKGCSGRTDWYVEQEERGVAGGEARAKEAPRDGGGRFTRQQTPASDQQTPAPASEADQQPSVIQPKIKDQDQSQGQPKIRTERESGAIAVPPCTTTSTEHGVTRPPDQQELSLSGSDPPFDPGTWVPEPNDTNTLAALDAKARGVFVEYALKKFRLLAKQKGYDAVACEIAWPLYLLRELPTPDAMRDALTSVERAKHARAALDRERAEESERAQRAEADREEVLRAAKAAIDNQFRLPAEKATAT